MKHCKEAKDTSYDSQGLVDAKFWASHSRFTNCTFRSTYLGGSKREQKPTIDISHITFVKCDFEACNFLGVSGLSHHNFIEPYNIATTHNLSPSIVTNFPHQPNSFSYSYTQKVNYSGATYLKVQKKDSQKKMTDFFSNTKSHIKNDPTDNSSQQPQKPIIKSASPN